MSILEKMSASKKDYKSVIIVNQNKAPRLGALLLWDQLKECRPLGLV
jgi:hypothetical protein